MRGWRLARLALAIGLAAAPARAQMTPLYDGRTLFAAAKYAGLDDYVGKTPPAPFVAWNEFADALVYNPDPEASGECQSDAWQISQFLTSAISASGGSGGSWYTPPLGPVYSTGSSALFSFRVTATVQYTLDAWLDSGDAGPILGDGFVGLTSERTWVDAHRIETGELHVQGRLAPGDYRIEGSSALIDATAENTQGPVYSFIWICTPCPDPLLVLHPRDTLVTCGATPTFQVTTSVPTVGLTFQWRRNHVPLTDGPHVSGATTPVLTLPGACVADTGWYDVVVTSGAIVEPSRLARLDASGTGAVDAPGPPAVGLALELAGPNPFGASTRLRWRSAHAQRATISVHDVTGARVRTLAEGDVQGSGTVEWDGRSDAGARLRTGVYFVRMSTPAGVVHRAIVLLD